MCVRFRYKRKKRVNGPVRSSSKYVCIIVDQDGSQASGQQDYLFLSHFILL